MSDKAPEKLKKAVASNEKPIKPREVPKMGVRKEAEQLLQSPSKQPQPKKQDVASLDDVSLIKLALDGNEAALARVDDEFRDISEYVRGAWKGDPSSQFLMARYFADKTEF